MADIALETPFYCKKLNVRGLHYITCIRRQQSASSSVRSKKRRNWDNVDGATLCNECLDCKQGQNIIKKLGITKPVKQIENKCIKGKKGMAEMKRQRVRRCRTGFNPYSPHFVAGARA
jgi:hypothetical protein